ncbi:MAG: chemotaxis protein CheB [Acidobacteria bacterium]|nr:chemotaxis protein CheB [Acidobacteriota bacterium]MBV9145506.1 chemotaxis protein CheB [Acidobacteriota bacterium]
MTRKDIVVIGASAGGIEALKILIPQLPKDLNAAVFIALHVSPYGMGIVPEILERAGSLPASNAKDWEPIQNGRIYVAPPDHHLLLEEGYIRVTRGPRENRFRPAIDPLFRSAAVSFGPRVIGVVLTGWLDDGTAGLRAIRERGGFAIVQHPDDAFAPSMPLNAIKHVEVDQILPLKDIGPRLAHLVNTPAGEEVKVPVSEEMELEVKIAKEEKLVETGLLKWGQPSLYSCPECHGVLLQLNEGKITRFRCHTGHAYSMESLLAEFATQNEETLWSAIRALEEHVILMKGLAQQAAEHGDTARSQSLLKKADEVQGRATLVRQALAPREPHRERQEAEERAGAVQRT